MAVPNTRSISAIGTASPNLVEYKTVEFPKVPREGITFQDVQKVVPTDMLPTEDAGSVINRIGDRMVQNWLQSDAVKSSSMGRTASTVEQAMKVEAKVAKASPTGVDHRFTFQYMPFQSLTRVDYKGWLNATFSYDGRAQQSGVEVKEKFFNKDLFVNHKVSNLEDTSSLGMRWSW